MDLMKKLQAALAETDDEYAGLEDADKFKKSEPDYFNQHLGPPLPHDKILQNILDDLQIMNEEIEGLKTQWITQLARRLAGSLRAASTLLDMLADCDDPRVIRGGDGNQQ
jgi:hypothetical protein